MHASTSAGREARARRLKSHAVRAVAALAVAGLAAGCSSASSSSAPSTGGGSSSAPGKGASTVGFIMVGEENDQGYNQAVYTAAQAASKDLGVKPLLAANVPETTQVTATMQAMVNEGAKVIFATSYGYYPFALAFAKSHPSIVIVHQGGLFTGPGKIPANFGTYWGEAFEPVSLGGMAAGATTKSDKLGFVYAFPIAQTIDNIDAFELGAQLTNPKAVTYTEATSEWCDPLKQKTAAAALLSQGADVLSQHQDCQSTVIEAAKAGGASVVGYHYDASDLDPTGWLTGSAWQWAPVYESIAKTAIAGSFTGSRYNANWVGTFQADDNPLGLASFGPKVDASLQSRITAKLATYKTGASIFKGPITCNNGKTLVPAGVTPTYAQINAFDCFVKGVVGTVPKS
ncbi:MAG TPA: BMP family ABC transporter substrate-binding protein [Solirubrobacteraceae bacterium]|jgi:simple sugar transport system substrate-binding protein/basic membrane protein A|nr:BMP family ABC transporter substrate-binding protein [Solirubrobacteraceae bacterium]